MLATEYRKKQQAIRDKRSWAVTISLGLIALLAWSGIVTIWKYIGHDGYVIVSVLIPLGFFASVLTLAAINGSRRVFRDVADVLLSLIYWWP
jgi:hypothetical protein